MLSAQSNTENIDTLTLVLAALLNARAGEAKRATTRDGKTDWRRTAILDASLKTAPRFVSYYIYPLYIGRIGRA